MTKHEPVVYFIQPRDRRYVKIGRANDIERRLAELQCGSPEELKVLGLMPGGRALELELHWQFSDDRMRGEWFHLSKELFRFIVQNALANAPGMQDVIDARNRERKYGVGRKTIGGWATDWMYDVLDEALPCPA